MRYEYISRPIKVGSSLELKNRIVMGPMGTGLADIDHKPTPAMAAYYEERAQGGVGLIIVEHTISQPSGYWGPHAAEIYSKESIPLWKMVVDAVHRHDGKIAIEIGHMGRCTTPDKTNGFIPVAPSAVPCHVIQYTPHEVSISEIEQFKKDYLNCAVNAAEADFDALELHLTNGYFLAEWLSGRSNKRTDKYGGTIEGRLRLSLEIIQLIRQALGKDFPLIARLASREVNSGRDIEETKIVARALEEAGVNLLDINAGSFSEYDWEFPPYHQPQGFLLEDIERIKRSVDIPVIAGGRIVEPLMAEQILLEGRADLVSINRGHIADPNWVKKTISGEAESIRRCIGCTRCIDEVRLQKLRCSVNPFAGRELELNIRPAEKMKNIMVVGGGPAGLQAAVIAAKRGHTVKLVEKNGNIGGLARAAAVPPLKWEIASIISTLANDADKHGVEVVLNRGADAEFVTQCRPDAVILATGSSPLIPNIPGVNSECVKTATDILLGHDWVGKKVAIIGGGMVGCETAEYLSEYKKDITIYEMLDKVCSDMWTGLKLRMLKSLDAKKIKINTSSAVTAIGDDGVITYLKNNKEIKSERYNTILLAVGMRSTTALQEKIRNLGIEVKVVGDAVNPTRFHEALTSAVESVIEI